MRYLLKGPQLPTMIYWVLRTAQPFHNTLRDRLRKLHWNGFVPAVCQLRLPISDSEDRRNTAPLFCSTETTGRGERLSTCFECEQPEADNRRDGVRDDAADGSAWTPGIAPQHALCEVSAGKNA